MSDVASGSSSLSLARLDIVQDPDGVDRMLVDRVHVVHVVLHLRHDAAEVRHEAAEDAGLVHAAERRLRVLPRRQDLHEEPVRLGIVPELAVDQLQRLGDEPQCVGVDVEIVLIGDIEEADQVDGIVLERGVGGDVEALALHQEALDLLLEQAPAPEREFRLALLLHFQDGAEDPRQVAHVLGDEVVVLHEALDAAGAGVIGVAHEAADLALQVEGEPVLGAAGDPVQVAAHGPEEILRPGEALGFLRG